jgi:hypothetical protein
VTFIVGLTGKKGHGKDTVGSYLVEHHGFERASFAEPMKASASAALGVTVDDLEGWKNNPHAIVAVGLKVEDGYMVTHTEQTIRSYLQRYGTEAHREIPEFGENVWTDMIVSKIDAARERAFGVVVTDVRFDNEAEVIRAAGGTIVKVYDPRKDDDGADTHASEQLPEADWTLWNGGTFEDLYKAVRFDLLGVPEPDGMA